MFQEDLERQLFKSLQTDLDNPHQHFSQSVQAANPLKREHRDITSEDLNRILAAHKKWIESRGNLGHRANLSRVNLRGVNLARTNLQGANLAGADLQGANPFQANLQGADLSGANLRESYLEQANLQGANLEGANLQEAYLVGANLRSADLAGVNLNHANLRMADLEQANLLMADLRKANLENANLLNVNLRFSNLQHTKIKHARMLSADLEKADLRGTEGLAISQLSRVKNLSQAKLDAEIKRQITDSPLSSEKTTIQNASERGGSAEQELPNDRLKGEKDLRRQPRRPKSKSIFIVSQNKYSKGLIKNISSFGAFIKTSTRFSRQQIIKLEIPGNEIDKDITIIGEVVRSDQQGIGVRFKKLIQSSGFSKDMGGLRNGADRRKLLFSEYYPEKRSGTDRREGADRRKLKYIKYYKYGLQLNRIIDNGGRRFDRDRRRHSFVLFWPENRSGSDRRCGKDRRTAYTTREK